MLVSKRKPGLHQLAAFEHRVNRKSECINKQSQDILSVSAMEDTWTKRASFSSQREKERKQSAQAH